MQDSFCHQNIDGLILCNGFICSKKKQNTFYLKYIWLYFGFIKYNVLYIFILYSLYTGGK